MIILSCIRFYFFRSFALRAPFSPNSANGCMGSIECPYVYEYNITHTFVYLCMQKSQFSLLHRVACECQRRGILTMGYPSRVEAADG